MTGGTGKDLFCCIFIYKRYSVAQIVKNLPAMWETKFQSLGWEDALEKELATQYSCLENPMDRGAWRAIVHGVAKSQA